MILHVAKSQGITVVSIAHTEVKKLKNIMRKY